MLKELQLLKDGCAALGVKESDVWTYRVTATEVRIVLKDGRKHVLEIVNLNPEVAAPSKSTAKRIAVQEGATLIDTPAPYDAAPVKRGKRAR
jgi:hypothetical protein